MRKKNIWKGKLYPYSIEEGKVKEKLRERYGIEAYEPGQEPSWLDPKRSKIRNALQEMVIGLPIGTLVGVPPQNGNLRPACIVRFQEKGGELKWFYRAESPYWQADLFLSANLFNEQAIPEVEHIYAYFDSLQAVLPAMQEAVDGCEYPWTQKKTENANQIYHRLREPGFLAKRMETREPDLYQRYG